MQKVTLGNQLVSDRWLGCANSAYGRNTCKIGHPVKFCKDGTFTSDYAGETKRLRSMKLTDTAWELLAEIAEKNQITRTEVIELFARGED